jgi:hypothetical protein
VEKARQLEVINREREVTLGTIAKEKEVELQKKEIADAIRARIAVDKTVATEEEAIKDLRAHSQATREKDVVRIAAEAEAQGSLVKQIKAAEASEEAAKFKAREKIVTADAELDTADKVARAKIRLAEGKQAEAAAEGLANVKVREADAVATEKLGRAAANVVREKLLAEAAGDEQKGLAEARVKEAEANAIEKRGAADASATRQKLLAEAAGIAEKASAMKALDEAGRGHEEFRLRLDKEKVVELESIRNRKEIAAAQAEVLKEAFSHAKINIVGGDGQFFDRFIKAVSVGQSIEGVMDHSDTVRGLAQDVLGRAGGDPAIAGLLSQFMSRADDAQKARLQQLLSSGTPAK